MAVSIDERINVLENFPLADQQPNIEAPCLSIDLDIITDVNYADRNAFQSKWAEDTFAMGKLGDILKRGEYFINLLYTYRSCSKALPQVKAVDDPNKADIYEKYFEVLEPEIEKLKQFSNFQKETVGVFCEQIKLLSTKEKKTSAIPEALIYYLIKMLDMFALLDALKNMKACFNNDFSFYKRAIGFLNKSKASEDNNQENHQLYLFLANQNSITSHLKDEVHKIAGFDDIIGVLVNQCATWIERSRYVTPHEKHCLLRVMPYGLFLMDGPSGSPLNIFKNKKVNLKIFSNLFRRFPIVPLYGDMQIQLESMITRSANFDEKQWGPISGDDVKLAKEYEIVHHLPTIRAEHTQYIARFSTMLNNLRINEITQETVTSKMSQFVFNEVLTGIKLLGTWTSRVLQQSAWKYAHPNPSPELEHLVEYERVVRHNYSTEELFALVEVIGMIKGLSGTMIKAEGTLAPLLRSCIHYEVQDFIQVQLKDMLVYSAKKVKKKLPVQEEIINLRILAGDWSKGLPDDYSMIQKIKKKKKDLNNQNDKIPERTVGPSITQLELIRTIVYSFFSVRLNGKRGYSNKEFSEKHFKTLEEFYERSFFYPYLSDMTGLIIQMTDLGDLWYREFYLELSKRLQFEIELSLPWLLTEKILESGDQSMLEYILYPFDIYNDAAHRALTSVNQQFLYDEIEAEVNLCFDQLIFLLSDQIYAYYKIKASSILFDNSFKKGVSTIIPPKTLNTPCSRFHAISNQRHFQLLGRSVDLNLMISQRLNNYLRKNIDNAISRFEAKDITSIIELETQLKVIRYTHSLMHEQFENLDSFDSIFKEVNQSVSLVSFHSRIIFHVIFELVNDLFPSFNYNSYTKRFIKNPISFGEEVVRENMPKTKFEYLLYGNKQLNLIYNSHLELYKDYFGVEHIKSIIRIIEPNNLPLVTTEILNNAELKINNVLVPYVEELLGAMPPSSKLPRYDYLVKGCIGYFNGKLADIIQYPPLQSDVFQHYKEFGNTVAFLYLLDHGVKSIENERFLLTSPFLGTTPNNYNVSIPSEEGKIYKACLNFQEYNTSKAPEILGDLVDTAWRVDNLYRITPNNKNSIFRISLRKLAEAICAVSYEWANGIPEEGAVLPVEDTTEFYRLYSALQFIYCSPPERGQGFDSYELFGDSMLWAGATIIHFLGQRFRFKAFDFSFHIINVHDAVGGVEKDSNEDKFIQNASRVRDVMEHIFLLLNSNVPYTFTEFNVIEPPEDDDFTDNFQIVSSLRESNASLYSQK